MKKVLALVLCLGMGLCACGQSLPQQPAETKAPDASETAQVPETEKETRAAAESRAEKAEEKEKPAAEPGETISPEQEAEPAEPEVENNGGNFVRIGQEIYFRKYGPHALDPSASSGNFTEYWNSEGGESEILAFDPATGKAELRFYDTGHGPLWYYGGSLYLQETIYTKNYVYRYGLDGSEAGEICEGDLVGITEDGILAVSQYDTDKIGNFGIRLSFYQEDVQLSESFFTGNYQTAGLDENGLYLLELTDRPEGGRNAALCQLRMDGTFLQLGELPEEAGIFDAMPGQFLSTGDRIGLEVGIYSGAMHYKEAQLFFAAVPDVVDSLQPVRAPGAAAGRELYLAAEGSRFKVTEQLPDQLRINSENGTNDLERWNGEKWEVLKRSFIPIPERGAARKTICQCLEYVDGIAFVNMANACVSPAEALGLHDMYMLLGMDYLAVLSENRVRNLASMELSAGGYGNVWFTEDGSRLIWQQLKQNEYETDAPSAYLLEITDDAVWDEGKETVQSGASFLSGDLEADADPAFGFVLPEEPGVPVFFHLDRNGRVDYLSRRFPDALLRIEFVESEKDLEGAQEKINPSMRVNDEDTPWYWTRITALADDVEVLIDRTPDNKGVLEEFAEFEGLFVPGSELYRGTLQKGEYLAARVSLPWHPEIRLSAQKDELYGSYVFGEDNYLHLERLDGTVPDKTLAAYTKESRTDLTGDALLSGLDGTWLCQDAVSGETEALISFYRDVPEIGDSIWVTVDDETQNTLKLKPGRLYADEYEEPDLLMLETCDEETEQAINMSGPAGDYRVERFRTDGQEIVHLIQANNGDGALDALLPEHEENSFHYTLVRYAGAGRTGAVRRSAEFTAKAVRYDQENGAVWLQEAEELDEYPGGGTIYGADPGKKCLKYELSGMEAFAMLRELGDPVYPMTVFRVITDQNGCVEALLPES